VIIVTAAATVPALLLYGLAQTWWQLLPGMILLMAGNLGTPSFSSYIVELSTPETRARTFALIYTVGPAAATVISPTLGGEIAERTELRMIFFMGAIASAISTVIFTMISERPLKTHHHDVKPTYREAFAVPTIRWVATLKFGVLASLAIGTTFLPNYLEDVHGLGIGTIGRFGSILALGSVVMALIVARVAWITGCKGISIGTLSVGAVCGVTLATGNPWILGPAFLMRGGFMVAWSLFHAVMGEVSPERLRGRAFALVDFFGGIGFGLAPFVAGALYGWRPSAPLVATIILAPMLAAAALVVERKFVTPAALANANIQSGVVLSAEPAIEGVA
jgi:MFS family permease